MKKLYYYILVLSSLTGATAVRGQDSVHCSAAFQAYPSLNEVEFIAFDSTPGVLHHWNFGDGASTSTDSNTVFHHYAVITTYLVTHVVIDSARHCQDSTSQYVTPGPNCAVSVSETSDTLRHRYTFVASLYSMPGAIDSVSWTI